MFKKLFNFLLQSQKQKNKHRAHHQMISNLNILLFKKVKSFLTVLDLMYEK